MLLSLVYFVKVIHGREVIENSQKCTIFGDYFCYSKTGGCALQIKIARDKENIFHFELCVNKV